MNHPEAAKAFLKDKEHAKWHDQAIWHARKKRDTGVNTVPEWEELRELASQIKSHTLSRLDHYLETFEANAKANGIQVHWAADGNEHNRIVQEILQKHGVKKMVKSKSMLTEECHLNPFLEKQGVEVVDTDLGERIVQLAKEPPSHIVTPAIHKRKEDVGDIFHQHLGTEEGASDPLYLTRAARTHLRNQFLTADAALTGVNFAIAETGGFVVCTNEGNADLGVALSPVHIACMGIEKLIPKPEHLGVFLRLLARNATGQPITTYSSHFHGSKNGQELHVVIVDNGRSEQLGRSDFRSSLHCIRCGACMNTCPIYRRSGGHSYGYTVPGPIGAILSPGVDLKKHASLPFASTLCGSCTDVCPVKIDIHQQLYKWRQIVHKNGYLPRSKTLSMKLMGYIFRRPKLFRSLGKISKKLMKVTPRVLMYSRLNAWGKSRAMPEPPKSSFRDWYIKNKRNEPR